MELDAKTTAALIGGVVLAVKILGTVVDKLFGLLTLQLQARSNKKNGSNGGEYAGPERRHSSEALLGRMDVLTTRIAENTEAVREVVKANFDLKLQLSEGLIGVNGRVDTACGTLVQHVGQVREFEQRVAGEFVATRADVRDSRDVVLSAVRGVAGGA